MKRLAATLIISLLLFLSPSAHAADDKMTGLNVSPSRSTLTAKPGETKTVNITVTNDSASPMTIPLTIEEFIVDSATNELDFKSPDFDWAVTKDRLLTLNPNQTRSVDFVFKVPQNAAAKEYYFALIASNQADNKTIRVASLVYLYVDGGKIDRKRELTHTTAPSFVFGGPIKYSFDIQNSGNVHAQTRSNAYLKGLSWYSSSPDTYQVTIPSRTNHVEGSVPQPFFPGVYTLTYGFTEEAAQKTTADTARIVYIPPWSIAALIVIVLAIIWTLQKRKR
ncbi:hypothetical protein EON76_00680 [bacterium]|nr:MAG: hypothetical protein EON76_00680 [bacterium]